MKVKEGYKLTELGVIPEDWKIFNLDDKTIKIGSGITPTGGTRVYKTKGRTFLRSQNVGWGNLILDDVAFIDDKTHETFNSTEIKKGDVFLNITGASIGRSAIADERVEYGNVNQHVCIIRPKDNELNSLFLNYFLLSTRGQKQIDSFQAGGNRQGLNFGQIKSFKISLPSKQEQTIIAKALSDVDSLIQSLEKLIVKKQSIKQGIMQLLLTGKKRLPSFSGEWKVKKLGEIADIKTGKKNNEDKVEDGIYPFFVRSQNVEKIDSFSFDGEAILVPGEGGIGTIIHYIKGRFDYHQRVYKISNFTFDTWGKYVYYCMMMNFNNHATKNSVKATVDSLRLPTFKNFELLIPSFNEQAYIAKVITDLENELAALENKLHKYKLIKQGLMQNLLTGKIRLV